MNKPRNQDLRAALDDAASHDNTHTCSPQKVHRHLRVLAALASPSLDVEKAAFMMLHNAGRHDVSCRWSRMGIINADLEPCTCGLLDDIREVVALASPSLDVERLAILDDSIEGNLQRNDAIRVLGLACASQGYPDVNAPSLLRDIEEGGYTLRLTTHQERYDRLTRGDTR